MTAPRPKSRSSTLSNNDAQIAALRGATKAFAQTSQRNALPGNLVTRTNSACSAATTAGKGSNASSPVKWTAPPAQPAASAAARGYNGKSDGVQGVTTMRTGNAPSLGAPVQSQKGHVKSPSQAAASLAQAQAPSPSPSTNTNLARSRTTAVRRPAVAPKPRTLSSDKFSPVKRANTDGAPDSSSIPPTTSLVDLFERKNNISKSTKSKPEPVVIRPSNDLVLKSPKPIRTSGGLSSVFRMDLEESTSPTGPTTHNTIESTSPIPQNGTNVSLDDDYATAAESLEASVASLAAKKPQVSPTSERVAPSLTKQVPMNDKDKPSLPLRRTTTQPVPIENRRARTVTSPSEKFSPSSASVKSIPAQWNHLHPRAMTPNMTGDQLANAMVAGSLASSRAPSPRKQEPPPPPTRRQKHHTFSMSRTPSPSKSTGMRHTLRKAESESSDDDDDGTLHPYGKHKKKRHGYRHPNKHHEGDRKRWRDAVTERERKRYEGVWAANKGLFYSYTQDEQTLIDSAPDAKRTQLLKDTISDSVSNIVARDIWSRSRLPEDVLEFVWDLVDSENVGRLSKEEFVVGMWLIDQRLKGRKSPVKISDTVWASVRGLQGIKIKKSL